MNQFTTKLACLLLLIALIGGYQAKVVITSQAAEINAMETALEEAKMNLEAKAAEEEAIQEETNPAEADGEENTDDSGFKDGTYQGEAQGYGGTISLNVTIKNGTIEAIDVVSAENEDNAYFGMATAVIDNIINAQSTEVDAISGATYSSTGIKNAVAAAVMKAAGQ